jgi:hypothetical protein
MNTRFGTGARGLIGLTALMLLILGSLTSCRKAPAPTAVVFDLPDAIPGFVAGAREPGDGYVRRTYTAGATRINVTLARHPMDDAAWDGWVHMSAAGFPQADLGLPAEAGNGFYQCDDRAPDRCDLLIQLRAGVHIEIRGGGTSTRRDVDSIRRGLPITALAR